MPRHNCALCGQISFSTYHEYEIHRTEAHGMKTAIKPEKVTGRTRSQIVEDAERAWLKPFVIEPDTTAPAIVSNNDEHLPACRCMAVCFNRKLDELIAAQEKTLQNLETSDIDYKD